MNKLYLQRYLFFFELVVSKRRLESPVGGFHLREWFTGGGRSFILRKELET